MINRMKSFVGVVALVSAFSMLSAVGASAQQGSQGSLAVPISGTTNIGEVDVPFTGTFNIQRFQRNAAGDGLEAVGTAVLQVTDAAGLVRTIVRELITPILGGTQPVNGNGNNGPGTVTQCPILVLEIPGGLNIDLLGLVIDLEPVRLEIGAEPGPGRLLGNLLCAIVGLLDGGGPLQQLVARLNNLLGLLG
jgi:hypothetical protein